MIDGTIARKTNTASIAYSKVAMKKIKSEKC